MYLDRHLIWPDDGTQWKDKASPKFLATQAWGGYECLNQASWQSIQKVGWKNTFYSKPQVSTQRWSIQYLLSWFSVYKGAGWTGRQLQGRKNPLSLTGCTQQFSREPTCSHRTLSAYWVCLGSGGCETISVVSAHPSPAAWRVHPVVSCLDSKETVWVK